MAARDIDDYYDAQKYVKQAWFTVEEALMDHGVIPSAIKALRSAQQKLTHHYARTQRYIEEALEALEAL